MTTRSEIARAEIEKKIELLAQQIGEAEGQQGHGDITDPQFEEFLTRVRFTMEHLEDLLLYSKNVAYLPALFGLVFAQFPTYQELGNRTLKLSLMFQLSRRLEGGKSALVVYFRHCSNAVRRRLRRVASGDHHHRAAPQPTVTPNGRGYL